MLSWLERRLDVFAPFDETRTPPADLLGFFRAYLAPARGWLFVLLALSIAAGVMEAGVFLLIGAFVDLVVSTPPERLWADHGSTIFAWALAVLIGRPLLLAAWEAVSNQVVIPPLTSQIRWRTHVYTLGHALSYFQGDFAGRLANRVMQGGAALRDAAVTTIEVLAYVAVHAVVAIVAFTAVSPWLAVPMLLWVTAYALLLRAFVPRAVALSATNSAARSVVLGRIVDSYTNILTVKLFARTDEERSSVRSAIDTQLKAYQATTRLNTLTNAALVALNTALLVVLGLACAWLWSRSAMSAGEIAAGLALGARITGMSTWVMQTIRGVFENVGTVQESMETISKPHGLVDAPDAAVLHVPRGEVVFEKVSFDYGRKPGPVRRPRADDEEDDAEEAPEPVGVGRRPRVIQDLSLRIAPGEKVGLVGPSGAGKSTIVSLLLRLHEPESGRILVDGQDIARVTQDSLREAVAVVTQDTSLLHRSIRDNIAYGRPGSPEADVVAAARMADADGFIARLEDHKGRRGLDSHVGERGVKLSGGQRQRVAIARVLLKDAPILVLDEATSALDSEAEAAIQAQLERLMEGKTVIAIAHRLSTIAALDRLVVLDAGRVVEEGTHAELVARGGLYARLWSRQSGGFLGGRDEDAREAAE